MYLIFDTETTGLPDSYDAPPSDVDNWPRIVQLAWEAFNASGRKTGAQCYVIRPVGFKIPKEAEKKHGISTARAKRVGIPVAEALGAFAKVLKKASVTVAHNHSFDASVVGAEFYRLGIKHQFRRKRQVCTMKDSTEYCALPGRYGYKWPKLPELHLKLFGKSVQETHDAMKDTANGSRCFFELKRRGVIRVARGARR